MLNEITLHSKQLIETFKLESIKQNKEIQYLDLQRKIIEEQQQKLNELSQSLGQRVGEMQENVGI